MLIKNLIVLHPIIFADFLGKTFVPIKTEVKGHVKGLETRFLSSNEITFEYIVDIIEAEKVSKKSNMPSSATSALIWIMRNLMFLHHFLRTYVESECSIKECLRLSYENTLMKNHEQTIRNVFAVRVLVFFKAMTLTYFFVVRPYNSSMERRFNLLSCHYVL